MLTVSGWYAILKVTSMEFSVVLSLMMKKWYYLEISAQQCL